MKKLLKYIFVPIFCLVFMCGCSLFLPIIDTNPNSEKEEYTVCEYVTTCVDQQTGSEVTSLSEIFNQATASSSAVKVVACYNVSDKEVQTQSSGFIYSKELNQSTNKYTYYIVTSASGIFYRYISNANAQTQLNLATDTTLVTTGAFEIAMEDGHIYQADVVGYFDAYDICVLKFEAYEEYQNVIFGNSDELEVGDDLYIIGTPECGNNLINSEIHGMVSGLERLSNTYFVEYFAGQYCGAEIATYPSFQFDASVNIGMEGAPIFNASNEVVGMTTYKYGTDTKDFSYESLSFGMYINDVKPIVDSIITTGSFAKPLMGVTVCDMVNISAQGTGDWVANYNLYKGAYIIVGGISEGGPAAKAGVDDDVVIIEASQNGVTYEITGLASIYSLLVRVDRTKPLTLTYINNQGQRISKTLNLN